MTVRRRSAALPLVAALAAAALAAPAAAQPRFTQDEQNTIDIVKRAKTSVVFITTIGREQDFFSFDVQEVPLGSGSGFIWDRDGHIVTNYHVVNQGVRFSVTLPDQKQRDARLVGVDPNKDVAVLRLEGTLAGLTPVETGESRTLEVGQKTVAIGNPFGFDYTVTTGIVSAVGRSIQGAGGVTIKDMIQTDASINPGNSGGPLLDSAGRLIGMNTMIISPSGTSAGVGFAVPSDVIRKVVPQIIRYGKVIRPGLGPGVVFLSDQIMERLDLRGAGLASVARGSEADQAGLRGVVRDRFGRQYLGDVIQALDGKPVGSYDDFSSLLEGYKVGDAVTLTVRRGDKTRKVRFVLEQE